MNYTDILHEINAASLFDLYRLHVAIGNELDNPKRLVAVKKSLCVGMELSYFHHTDNRSIKAKILELGPKNVIIYDLESQKSYAIPYFMLNLEGIDTTIHDRSGKLTINNLRVGEAVGFNHDGEDVIGIIKRLNQKTVTLITNAGKRWRVSYSYLYKVHDADSTMEVLLKNSSSENCYE